MIFGMIGRDVPKEKDKLWMNVSLVRMGNYWTGLLSLYCAKEGEIKVRKRIFE